MIVRSTIDFFLNMFKFAILTTCEIPRGAIVPLALPTVRTWSCYGRSNFRFVNVYTLVLQK